VGGWDPQQPGRYLLRKRGDAPAINVRVRLSYGGDEQTVSREQMTEDVDTLAFSLAGALRDYQRECEQRRVSASRPLPLGHVGRCHDASDR
jgi:hypothetical protein